MATREFFPEPTDPDDTWGAENERPVDWLSRSTLPRARSLREAVNDNLSRFEPRHAASLAKKLQGNWKSHYFELVVGRWLQELGAASVEHEPIGSNGKRIDYRATFRDGAVCVEAVSKVMNQHARMGVAYIDNSEQRVRQAFRDSDKRAQAQGASHPALLAIDGGIFGARLDQFDAALLGSSVEHFGFDRRSAGRSFNATTGEMAVDANSPWAGVLAFVEPGVFSATEPFLYISPHFRGHLPLAFLGVRRRMLAPVEFEGSADEPMTRIKFGRPIFDSDDRLEPSPS